MSIPSARSDPLHCDCGRLFSIQLTELVPLCALFVLASCGRTKRCVACDVVSVGSGARSGESGARGVRMKGLGVEQGAGEGEGRRERSVRIECRALTAVAREGGKGSVRSSLAGRERRKGAHERRGRTWCRSERA